MPLQGRLYGRADVPVAGVSRAGFYRHLVEVDPDEEEMELRDAIQRISWSIGGTMGIAVSPRNCAIAAWWSIGSGWPG